MRQVNGRLLGDESRYDADRYPDTWPDRYAEQSQVGPLSALSVNDGFAGLARAADPRGHGREHPGRRPARLRRQQLLSLLQARGRTCRGGAGAGPAPAEAAEVAAIDSPPMREVVDQLVTESDNQTAELLVKEMGGGGRRADDRGRGRGRHEARWSELGLARTGTQVADGSGLDENNKVSCRLLMNILDQGGPDGLVADGLADRRQDRHAGRAVPRQPGSRAPAGQDRHAQHGHRARRLRAHDARARRSRSPTSPTAST